MTNMKNDESTPQLVIAPALLIAILGKAVVAMSEDGWLMHGAEGMSNAQEKAYEAYEAYDKYRAILEAAPASPTPQGQAKATKLKVVR